MLLNQGQPGMGGDVVQAENSSPRFGSKAVGLLKNYLAQAQRKEYMDYQHSLNMERDTHREAAKTTGDIFRKRADMEHWKEGIDHIRTNPNDPDGPKGPMPQSFRVGQVSHDTGSTYAKDMQDLIKMKQDTIRQQQELKEKNKQTKNTNTPGGKGGGKAKNKVAEPKERPGTLKDTKAALKAGHIDVEQAAEISPTFAKHLGQKAAADKMRETQDNSGGLKLTPAQKRRQARYEKEGYKKLTPKQPKQTPNKVVKPKAPESGNTPKPPKPPKAGM